VAPALRLPYREVVGGVDPGCPIALEAEPDVVSWVPRPDVGSRTRSIPTIALPFSTHSGRRPRSPGSCERDQRGVAEVTDTAVAGGHRVHSGDGDRFRVVVVGAPRYSNCSWAVHEYCTVGAPPVPFPIEGEAICPAASVRRNRRPALAMSLVDATRPVWLMRLAPAAYRYPCWPVVRREGGHHHCEQQRGEQHSIGRCRVGKPLRPRGDLGIVPAGTRWRRRRCWR